MTSHTVGQQQANVSQQGSSADTKPVARRIENSKPIIFDPRGGHDEAEDHGIRVVHFYIGDDDDDDDDDALDIEDCEMMEIENEQPEARRLGEERDDVAIIIDSGADVALFPLNMADHELEFNSATKLQHAQGNRIPKGCEKCRNLLA